MDRMIERRSRLVGDGAGVFVVALSVVALVASADEGCTLGCTEVGCFDQTVVTLQTPGGVWAAGTYTIEVTAGSLATVCTFTATDPMSAQAQLACSMAAIQVIFDPYSICATGDNAGAGIDATSGDDAGIDVASGDDAGIDVASDDEAGGAIVICQGVPSAFDLRVTVPGTSPQITIVVTRDGQPAGGGVLVPQYRLVQPNGASCGPTCHEATGDMVVGA